MGARRMPIAKKKFLLYSKKKAAIKAKYYKLWVKISSGEYIENVYYKFYDLFFDRFYYYKYLHLKSKDIDVDGLLVWGDFEVQPLLLDDYSSNYYNTLKDYHYIKVTNFEGLYGEAYFNYHQEYILKPYSDFLTSYFSVSDYFYFGIMVFLFFLLLFKFYKIMENTYLGLLFLWIFFWFILSSMYLNYSISFVEYFSILYYFFMEEQEFLFGYILKIGYFYGIDGDDDEEESVVLDSLPFYQYEAIKDFTKEREQIRRTLFRKDSFQSYLFNFNEVFLNFYKQHKNDLYPVNGFIVSKFNVNLLKRKENDIFSNDFSYQLSKRFSNVLVKNRCFKPMYLFNFSLDLINFKKLRLLKGLWSKFLLLVDNKILLLYK